MKLKCTHSEYITSMGADVGVIGQLGTMVSPEEVQLLLLLKGTVEGLLISQVPNVWSIYGGLNRLHTAMERIFKHGFRVFNQDGEPDLWVFINGLSWLQPNLATSPTLVLESYRESPHVPPHIIRDKALVWIYKSLETHTLSQKLSWLLSDREHLLSCYESSAFLSQEKFGEAALICLRAVEHNQSSLLTEINPCLYMTKWNPKVLKTHRRCSSYPETLERNSLWLTARSKGSSKATMGIIGSRCEEGLENDVAQASEALQMSESHSCELPLNSNSLQSDSKIDQDVASAKPQDAVHSDADAASIKEEPKIEVPKICLDKIKAWSSLPSLCGNVCSSDPRERSLTLSGRPWALTKKKAAAKRSGSRTLPSTPVRSVKASFLPVNQLEPAENKLSPPDSIAVCSKLSPSVLQVDYSGLQHWDSSDVLSKSSRTPPSKKALQSKRTHTKGGQSKQAHRKVTRKSTSSKGHPNKEDKNDGNSMFENVSDGLSTALRPTNLEIPTKVWQGDRADEDPMKNSEKHTDSPLKQATGSLSRRRKLNSAPSLSEWSKDSTLNSSCTPPSSARKSFMEDGGSSVQPMSTGFFPRPVEGQSLFSFLSSGQFSRAHAELDRENAHFSISEAMIAAIEQVKCNNELQSTTEQDDGADESDEEINHLKQRLRLRRHQRQEEQQRRLMWGVTLLSDGKTDTTTTDQSISPLSTSPGSPSDSLSTDGVEDLELDDPQNIVTLKDSGLSMSMASLFSEAELSKPIPVQKPEITFQESILSAESVALSLIKQFSEKQLPRASDLKWLVSEQEAPQQLLPLPKSWPVSPDEVEEDMRQATPLRGNMEWAPPRPQIIFTPHPNPVRRILLAKQSYRCAGCGMKVASAYAHRFRYCEYLGRYFCTGCHSNQMSPIPGRVLTKWDFTRYPVSSFSYRLLDQMFLDPLFYVSDLNPGLYRKSKALERCRQFRLQLFYLKDFLLTCRFATALQEVLEREPSHMISDVDMYSMMDLEQVKQGELPSRLRELVAHGNEHASQCELCLARGFVCELCRSKEVIFPWQLSRVTRCSCCGSCYHTRCNPPVPCPRCKRISVRQAVPHEDDLEADTS